MTIHERILVYAELLYQKSLESLSGQRYRKAEITTSAAGGAAMFLAEDSETPTELKRRAVALVNTVQALLGDIRRAGVEEYGERFMSGKNTRGKRIDDEIAIFFEDIRSAAQETQRLASQ